MSEIFTRNDVPRGYLNPEEVEEYVNRIRCAAMFGDTAPSDQKNESLTDKELSDEQKKVEVRYEVIKICNEWRERVRVDCSYRHLSKEHWEKIIKERIRDDARKIINHITEDDLVKHDDILDKELKWICITWLEDFHTTIEYCPNNVCITPKDIYDSLWRCRDFELDHLWQRSVFISAFLVICFTGYGAVMLKIFDYSADATLNFDTVFVWLNLVELFIAAIGIILSGLWIMMGKGSKAWYEQYEQSIVEIESNPKYSGVMPDMWNDRVMHGSLKSPPRVEDELFNTDAGRYSVSKINIIIGQVSMLIWVSALSAHFVLTFSFGFPLSDGWMIIYYIGRGLVAIFLTICVIWFFKKCKCYRSSSIYKDGEEIREKEKEETKVNIENEIKNPKTLIVLGDRFKQDNKKSSYFPTDSRYISLDCIEQIDGIENTKMLPIKVSDSAAEEEAKKNIEANRRFFEGLSKTNMIVVYDSSFKEKYWPYLTEIVRVTGKNIFWMILCNTAAEKTDNLVEEQMKKFIELVGLKNYDIVYNPRNVFNPKDT